MKGMRFLWSVVLGAVSAVTAAAAPAADVEYAPANTDLIVLVNGEKLLKSKEFASLRATSDFRKVEGDMKNTLANYGMTMDDLLSTELLLFINTAKQRNPNFTLLARNRNGFARKMLAMTDGQFGDEVYRDLLKKDPVDGKEARVIREDGDTTAVIALEDDLIALLWNTEPVAAPVRAPGAKAAAALNTDAMVSIAFDNPDGISREMMMLLPQTVSPFLEGVIAAKADAMDVGDRLVVTAELLYPDQEMAQMAAGQFNGLIMMGQLALQKKNPEWARILRRARISVEDRKVRLSFKCRSDELTKALLK